MQNCHFNLFFNKGIRVCRESSENVGFCLSVGLFVLLLIGIGCSQIKQQITGFELWQPFIMASFSSTGKVSHTTKWKKIFFFIFVISCSFFSFCNNMSLCQDLINSIN